MDEDSKITPMDFVVLRNLMMNEVARNGRNPNTYYSNLFQRALDIVSRNVDEAAEPVESRPRSY